MADAPAYIALKIDYSLPIEVGDFVSLFTSLEGEFDRFVRSRFPDIRPQTHVFVKEIRAGSVEADLIATLGALYPYMEHALVIEDFVRRWGERLGRYIGGGRVPDASKTELRDLMSAVVAVAKDPHASSRVEAVRFEDGKKQVRAVIEFNTAQARVAADQIEQHRREIEGAAGAEYQRALMSFVQSNIKDTALGKRTGEWVVIDDISDRPLPLIYASSLAEDRIKYETREAEDNLYKKGFVVDVNLQTRGGRPVAYRVTNVHQVIDLPDDE